MALVAPLRQLAPHCLAPGERGAATATLSDSGVDLLLDLVAPPSLAVFAALAAFARAQNLARLAWRIPGAAPSPIAQARAPSIAFGGVAIFLPEEVFLQASAEADAALTARGSGAAVGDAPQMIADLYAGIGTFSLPLAARGRVHAVERDEAALGALAAAVARAGLGHRLTCERRDLDTSPLSPAELSRFDAAVFDPPRAGAKAQTAALAKSRVRRVIAVSCNPATFARDARALVDGGYRLGPIQPIDSFLVVRQPRARWPGFLIALDRAGALPTCTLMAFTDLALTPTLPRSAGEGGRFCKTNPTPPPLRSGGGSGWGLSQNEPNPPTAQRGLLRGSLSVLP